MHSFPEMVTPGSEKAPRPDGRGQDVPTAHHCNRGRRGGGGPLRGGPLRGRQLTGWAAGPSRCQALAAATLAAAASLALVSCGGQTSAFSRAPGAGGPVGNTLTVGFSVQAPQTLDPPKTPQNYAWFEELAY